MFLLLLGITFVIALVVSFIVAQIFNKPLASILRGKKGTNQMI